MNNHRTKFVNLAEIDIDTNSPLWQVTHLQYEDTIQITNNQDDSHIHGKVALLPYPKRNYRMQVEMKFLGHYLPDENAGWFGLVIQTYEEAGTLPTYRLPTGLSPGGQKHSQTRKKAVPISLLGNGSWCR